MEYNKFYRHTSWLFMIFIFMFVACSGDSNHQEHTEHNVGQTYTCPMHPQVIQNTPGTCPVCSMDLVPFDKNSEGDALVIDETRQALANITTARVGTDSLVSAKRLNGRLVVNPDHTSYVSSRVAGRVDQLYIRELGLSVKKGQPLYRIYSEQLSVLQQEYLLATAQVQQFPTDDKFKELARAAKQKLLLYSQTPAQIQALEASKKTEANVVFYAPRNGTVAELSVVEGQYVEEGSPIMRIENLEELWVEADIYSNELANVKVGSEATVTVSGWEDQPRKMKIQFINPSLQTSSQLLQIRGSIPNPNGQWQVGQQVNVFLPMKSSEGVLSLPVDAVIRTGEGTHVWVETEINTFESRMVRTGLENSDQVEIVSGLTKGDKVVVTGTYLLNSEYILKKGNDPMAGHSH